MAQDPITDGSGWGKTPVMTAGMAFRDYGSYGLRQYGGWVREEYLPDLVGRNGARAYREMLDGSAVIGGMMFAIQQTMRKVEWRVEAASDKADAKAEAEFVESLMDDMSHTWQDFVAEALSMLAYGYAPHEIVYKRRLGNRPESRPGPKPAIERASSKFNDGRIGWRRLPIRGQDTVIKWFFDANGQLRGFTQQPWIGQLIDIPIEKTLLFRPTAHKNNPEGRALDPDTAIPTPDGWRKLDEIHEGSKVFDEAGCIRYVTARADWNDRPVYRLTFSDGSEIIADANHQWCVQSQHERNKRIPAKLRTTEDIARSIKTPAGVSNYSIPWGAHYIVAAEPAERRRTVCIEVDGPSHLFLAGEGMVPTHNSVLRNAYRSWFFTKRLEEQEAILIERMNGFPVMYVPTKLLDQAAANSPGAQAKLDQYKTIITNIRIDEQMGAIIPSDTYPDGTGKPSSVRMYELQFVTPQHPATGKADTDKVISRHKIDMMMTLLCDFLMMGHEVRGTNNLAVTKVDMFYQAVEGWLNSMAAVVNRYGLPRIWRMNGIDLSLMPQIIPDMAQRLDLDSLGSYITALASAGAPLFPDEELQTFLREAAGMPSATDPKAMAAAQQTNDPDTLKRMLKAAMARQILTERNVDAIV